MDPKYIKRRYFTPRAPGSYSALQGVLNNNKYKNKETVENTLNTLKTYVYHKPVRKKFRRRPIICPNIDYMWSSDLIVYKSLRHHNRQYSYIVLVVDCLSKFLFCVPIKKKTTQSVKEAFIEIFKKTKRRPSMIFVDQGTEYFSKVFKDFLAQHKIRLYHSFSKLKSVIAERFVRTVKTKIARHFTHTGKSNWVDKLQEIVTSINDSVNSSIGMAPSKVNQKNVSIVWHNLYHKVISANTQKAKYTEGTLVKIARNKLVFDKGYAPNFSEQTFKIKQVHNLHPVPVYTLEDLSKEEIQGGFYENEITPVPSEIISDE